MKKLMVAIVCMFSFIALSADETENTLNDAKYYDNAKVIRIKNVEGEGFVQRSYEEGYEEATPNLTLFDKDTVGTTAGRLGIYLGRLNYLRLDSDTMVELLSVPQLRTTDLVARIERGAVYLDIESLDKEKAIEIQTPDCGIFLLDKGLYRINVNENAITEIYVIEGIAEVAGQETSRNVRENQKIVMSRGQVEERPYYFFASEKDDFDRWNETQNREQSYARYGTARYLQSGYEDYEYEMSRAGRWSYMSDFNSYVWIPYFSNSSWMPYANGRWVYNPYYGYVWISYDNCGWFTHHYGRWHWDYASGWYWIPAYHWSPAWVSWFGNNDYYGWCPLSWWNRPVIIINNRWDRNYNYRRGIPHHALSTIIIRKNEISAPNAQRVALRKGNQGQGQAGSGLIAYRGTAPSGSIAHTRVSVINARGKTMTFKQNGIGLSEKYKINPDAGQVAQGSDIKAAVYKYTPGNDVARQYTPRGTYRRQTGSNNETRPATHYRSKTDGESSSKTRVRSSNSAGSESRSGNNERTRGTSTSTSSPSSSSSDAAGAAKKKRDQAAYNALLQSENSAGFKSHALGMASSQSGYSSRSSDENDKPYRSDELQTRSKRRVEADYSSASVSQASSARRTTAVQADYPRDPYYSHPNPSANYEAEKESRYYQNSATHSTSYNTFPKTNPAQHNFQGNSSHNESRDRGNSSDRSDNHSRSRASDSSRMTGRVVALAPRTTSSTVAKKRD